MERKIETSFSLNERDLDWIKGWDVKEGHGTRNNTFEIDNYEDRFKTIISNFDKPIDGNKLQDNLFPKDKQYDIFISHSHNDMDNEVDKKLQVLFASLGLSCFIDGLLWKNSREALDELNKEYSDYDKIKSCFSHEKCNRASEHMNNLLALTLTQAMNRSKAVMFINTSNSLNASEYVSGGEATLSPWINYELAMLEILPKTYHPNESTNFSIVADSAVQESLEIMYRVETPSSLRSSFGDIYQHCIDNKLRGNKALDKILSYRAKF